MITLQTLLARALVRLARTVAPSTDARAKLGDVLVILGRGGPGAPE